MNPLQPQQRSWLTRSRSFFQLGLLLAIVFSAATIIPLMPPGLNSPQPMGAYLDGAFPSATPGGGSGNWEVVNAYPNLTFVDPLAVLQLPDQSGYYVVGKPGYFWKISNDPNTTVKTMVLNLSSKVDTDGDSGLMNAILHPEFGQPGSPNRGYMYTLYRYHPNGNISGCGTDAMLRLSRFNKPDGSQNFDPNSEYVLMQIYDEHCWHNGGGMFFDGEGYFYVIIGDAGGANDQYNTGQQIDRTLLGGLHRIDLEQDPSRSHPIRRQPVDPPYKPTNLPNSFTQGYYIPNDNPWQDPNGGILEEFYAHGFRSPHRAMLDAVTGDIWVGDVGQGTREEVTVVGRGDNAQWPYREGSIAGIRPKPSPLIGVDRPPIYDYGRSEGNSVIGGFVYRGSKWQGSLGGKYIFGDHGTRNVWTLDPATGQVVFLVNVPDFGVGGKKGISNFSTNAQGDVFITKLYGTDQDGGVIYRLNQDQTVPDPPQLLSQTGAFTDLASLTPAAGLVPYSVNTPLWSDGAAKSRWIALPNDGSHNTANEQITFSATGEWQFPEGTVFVKHFELPIDANNPSLTKRLETRFVVMTADGGAYGVTYKWNDAGTEAVLLTNGDSKTFTVTRADGSQFSQTWNYPSRTDCMSCHTSNANFVLGVKTWQLNGDHTYPSGITDNQLNTWNFLGMFDNALNAGNISNYLKSAPLDDNSASLETRVRSYLDANCAHCHRPGGVNGAFDARFSTPLTNQNLINTPGVSNSTPAGHVIVKPQDPPNSELWIRDNSLAANAMPPLAKELIDEDYISVLTDWINSLEEPACQTTYLTDLSWVGTPTNGWGPVEIDESNGETGAGDGTTLTINGQTFARGLGVHANSEVIYNLAGQYETFRTFIGVDDESCDAGSVQFQIFTDGTLVYQSPTLTQADPAVPIQVGVSGVNQLRLVVNDANGSIACDHADWADAKLEACATDCAEGDPCNDDDLCTVNDAYDADCNCVGTFQDSDNDGVCDSEDQCPGFDDTADADGDGIPDACEDCDPALEGTACTDNDPCTVNDVYDADCNCAGTFQDGDNDGICDSEDQCPGFDDNLIGTACNDNDPDTTNDVYTADCDCVGTPVGATNVATCVRLVGLSEINGYPWASAAEIYLLDADGNPLPRSAWSIHYVDSEETSAGNHAGAEAIDGDINSFWHTQWSTAVDPPYPHEIQIDLGGSVAVTALQYLPRQSGSTNGMIKDYEIYLSSDCTNWTQVAAGSWTWGTDRSAQEVVFAGPACPPAGTACTDGDPCTVNDQEDGNCNCVGVLQDSDGDGICDSDDQCPGFDDALIGTACTDNDPCTSNDVYTADCECTGTFQDSDGDGVCDEEDQCPGYDDTADADGDGTPDGCDECDTNLIGVACTDNDPCTVNDVYDADCNCVGTFQDSDNDGVCDSDDQCPGSDDALIGTACTDNDPCTINDVYNTDCACAGTFQDSDADGVCDNDDQCPGFDDSADADGDGIPDGCDDCNENLIGTACTDNDPCTVNDVYDANCNCVGTFQDSDADGVCDNDDQCPNFDDSLIGTPCSDNDPNTTNDVYTFNCTCEGTPVGATNEATCVRLVGLSEINGYPWASAAEISLLDVAGNDLSKATWSIHYVDSEETAAGNHAGTEAIDGDINSFWHTQWATAVDPPYPHEIQIDLGGSVAVSALRYLPRQSGSTNGMIKDYEVYLSSDCLNWTLVAAGSWNWGTDRTAREVSFGAPSCPPAGTACTDGDPCTINDQEDGNCNCAGTFQDSDGDGVCDSDDQCPGFDDTADADGDGTPDGCDECDTNLIGTTCTDGDPCTVNDVYDADCNCAGTFQDSDGDGVCDSDDQCPGFDDTADADGDGTPDGCDECDTNLIGTTCTDGDPCTVNDVYDADCNCAGTFQDSDGDGVCDSDDQCPGFDDTADADGDGTPDGCDECDTNLIGTTCTDGDPCTVNDVYDADCNCAGTFQDSDGDGVCDSDDQCPGFDDTADADGDGTPDGCDECDTNLIGTTCSDGDPCTTGDVYDAACNCAGTFQDSDGDGVCDSDDLCPGFDDNLIGTACDDNDPGTTGDVYTGDCDCVGTPVDATNEATCVRLVGLSEINGYPWASAAEISLLDAAGNEIPKTTWSIHYVDSEETTAGPHGGESAIDNNVNTFWHTEWITVVDPPYPHEIQIDLGGTEEISAFRYLPRQSGSTNGMIKEYEFYLSSDCENWTKVAEGSWNWGTDRNAQEVAIASGVGAKAQAGAAVEVNAAELAPPDPNSRATARPGTPTTPETVIRPTWNRELRVRAQPNPFRQEFSLYIERPIPEMKQALVWVMDAHGRVIYQRFDVPFDALVTVPTHRGWLPGTYYVRVQASDYVKTIRIVKY